MHQQAPQAPHQHRTRSLVSQLSLRVGVIVALVAVILSAAAWSITRAVTYAQVDQAVQAAAARQDRPRPGGGNDPTGAGQFGNPIGSIFLSARGQVVHGQVVSEGSLVVPPSSDIQALLRVPTNGQIQTVELSTGQYRVMATTSGSGSTQVTALPLGDAQHLLKVMALAVSLLTLVAVAVAVLTSITVVRRRLRGLQQVAATAMGASDQQLTTGEVELSRRVEERTLASSTEVQQVGTALNRLLDSVEQALAARQASETRLRQFVADASHELRNPLAAIRGYAELSRRDRAQLPSEVAHGLARIDAESERMGELVEDLLLLARLDNSQPLALDRVDLTQIAVNAVSDAQAAGPDHEWSMELPDEPVLAIADAGRATQVLANLLSNARNHTPAGTEVEVRVVPDGDQVHIEVADNGPGIDPALQATVFERFVRADAARAHHEHPSTGLGLSIVQALMQAMGGRVGLASTVAAPTTRGGSTFILTFCRALPDGHA